MKKPVDIIIVEDEAMVSELIAVNLISAGFFPIRAYSSEQADSFINEALPALILLDWTLPKGSGIAYIRKLRDNERTKLIPIIMVTARSKEDDKILALEVGADDYVTKPFSPKELLARVKAVLRSRSPQLTSDTVTVGELQLDPVDQRVTANGSGASIKLHPAEFRLLHFLMTRPEHVHSRARLLDQLWGDHVFIEDRTVDSSIGRLRAALRPAGCDGLVQTVRGAGYRFVTNP